MNQTSGKPRLNYFLRPECGWDERWGPTIGPFPDYVQLAYGEITIGPNGGVIGSRGVVFHQNRG